MVDPRSAALGIFSPRVVRRALLIFLPAALLTGGVVLALYLQDVASEQALYEQAGAHLVDLHADIIDRELHSVKSDLLYLANQAVLRDYLSGAGKDRRELEDEYVLFSRQKAIYDQIRYLDASGNERIRVNYDRTNPVIVPDAELQPKGDRYYFTQTMQLARGDVFISPLDLNIENREIEQPLKPVIRFATPVFDRDRNKRGVLILNYLGRVLIDKLTRVAVGFPGQSWLLNSDGYFLRGPTPEDEWGFMLGHGRTFATYHGDAWERMAGVDAGHFQTSQGLFTFRSLSPRPTAGVTRSETVPQPAAGPLDPDSGDAGMVVVSHIPTSVLHGQANLLLGRLLLLYGVVLLLLLVLAWYLGHAGSLRRSHEQRLAESEGRLRTLSTRLMTAQEEERRSLSRDLHDELGQVVTAVSLDLQRAAQAENSNKKDELIGRALRGGERLLDCIHEISARVRPTLLDDLGLKDAVQSYLSDFEQRSGIAVRPTLHFEQDQVPAIVSENVYRVLQEALTNVSKHARSPEVFVELRVEASQVALTVRDLGIGFAPERLDGTRLGLLGMRERAELLNGTFTVNAAPGEGTEVRVTFPTGPADGGVR
jgi:signal transduction histidine kinase